MVNWWDCKREVAESGPSYLWGFSPSWPHAKQFRPEHHSAQFFWCQWIHSALQYLRKFACFFSWFSRVCYLVLLCGQTLAPADEQIQLWNKASNEKRGWGEVFSPCSEKYIRLVTNDKPSWCSIIHQKYSFWEAALRQPRNRSHFRDISLFSLRTSIFPKASGGPLSPQNQNAVQRPPMQRGGTCGEASTNSCCRYVSFRCCFWQVMLLLFLLATYLSRELLTGWSYPPNPLVLRGRMENGEKKITFAMVSARFWFSSHHHESWWRGG